MQGVYTLNESVAITRSRDKLRALQLLARKGIGMPRTAFAHAPDDTEGVMRSEEHTSELQSLMRSSYAVFCLKKKISQLTPQHPSIPQIKYHLLNCATRSVTLPRQ